MTAEPIEALSPVEASLRDLALSLPEATEDFPWGERVAKVKGKVFVFLGKPKEGGISLSLKLPQSAPFALEQPGASPTGYGLGRSGWVTFRYAVGEEPDLERLRHWLLESYRAVAPKKLGALAAL
ncbi:MAG TPA: MmcQ/YjbR family DNA-binding protein [Azospirillaceae bacterium]|nr:MmcQ/YjbR family DNA-binding protein [Azospirillaceae bacterium]